MPRSRSMLILVLFLLPAMITAQTTRGSIVGIITDPSGSVVINAKITVTQIDTGFAYSTTTNNDGNYVVPSLLPGRYSVKIDQTGFQTRTIEPIELNVDARVQVNAQLAIQGSQQAVNVSAEAPLVEAGSAALGQVIQSQNIVDLPLNGRNFLQLALLSAGAVPIAMSGSDAAGFHEPTLNISGGRESSNQFMIDGVFDNILHFEGLNLQLSIDAIQEFKIQRNTFAAEFGQGTAVVNVASRSGTNGFHGSLYEFLRNDALDARQFFDARKPPYRQNQFGFSFGGPIKKDKTFFFVNYEGLRVRQGNTFVATLPTAQQLSGNFAGFPPIKDPITGLPFAGNIIPQDRFSALTKRILPFLPTINQGGANNYRTAPSTSNDFDQATMRLDHRFSANDYFFGRFSFANTSLFTPGLIKLSGSSLTDQPMNGALQYTHNFSPTLLNEARFGLNRNLQNILQEGANGQNILQFQNISNSPVNFGLPTIAITGYSTFGSSPVQPEIVGGNTFLYDDDLTWIKGDHTFKFGIDVRFQQFPHLPYLFGRGQYIFAGTPAIAGDPVAEFLLGFPLVSIGAGKGPSAFMSLHQVNWYVQDDWKLTPRFTVNAGLRYERTGVITDRFRGRLGVFDEKIGQVVTGRNVDTMGLVNPDNNNFGPRIGFAWQPFHDTRTVIRAGYGIYYDVKPVNETNFSLGTELGFRQLVSTTQSWDALFPPAVGPAAGIGILTDDPFARTGYVHQYNFTVQREILPSLLVEAAYTGSEGRKLNRRVDLNQATLPVALTDPLPPRRPYPSFGPIVMSKDVATSNYNAVQLRAEKRFSHNLTFLGVYTYSKSLDTSSEAGDSTSGNAGIPQNRLNQRAEYGLSAFDQRQRFVLSYLYQLPFGKGQKFLGSADGLVNVLVSGWQINGITTFSSGNPFTVQVPGVDRSLTGSFGGGNQYANVVAGQKANLSSSQRSVIRWFNTTAFALAPMGTFGNSGRNTVIGPGTSNFDFSTFKNTKLTERFTVEFRSEFFNIFNKAQFNLPVFNPTSQAFGQITSVRAARQIQFGMKLLF